MHIFTSKQSYTQSTSIIPWTEWPDLEEFSASHRCEPDDILSAFQVDITIGDYKLIQHFAAKKHLSLKSFKDYEEAGDYYYTSKRHA